MSLTETDGRCYIYPVLIFLDINYFNIRRQEVLSQTQKWLIIQCNHRKTDEIITFVTVFLSLRVPGLWLAHLHFIIWSSSSVYQLYRERSPLPRSYHELKWSSFGWHLTTHLITAKQQLPVWIMKMTRKCNKKLIGFTWISQSWFCSSGHCVFCEKNALFKWVKMISFVPLSNHLSTHSKMWTLAS